MTVIYQIPIDGLPGSDTRTSMDARREMRITKEAGDVSC
jgi:hypothetical protein